jgi:hypothetical protein
MKAGVAALWFVLFVASACSSVRAQDSVTVRLVRDPMSNPVPMVELTTAGGVSGRFALDSGISDSCISYRFAAHAGLKTEPVFDDNGRPQVVAGQAVQKAPRVEFSAGGFPIRFERIAVLSEAYVRRRPGLSVDGVLGHDFFSHCAVEIDYAAGVARFLNASEVTADGLARAGFAHAIRVATTEIYDGDLSAIYADLPAHLRVRMVLDTGAPCTMVAYETATSLRAARAFISRAVATPTEGGLPMRAKIKRLAVGGAVRTGQEVAYDSKLDKNADPELGFDFMRHFRVLLDLPRHTVYFVPNPPRPGLPGGPTPQ